VDGQLGDAFVLAGHAESLLLDLAPDLVEIDETLVEVEELAPFSTVSGGRVDQLENERSTRHDALAAWQEIAPDDADSGGIGCFLKLENANRGKKGELSVWWSTYFSSTLDLPADWLPTFEKNKLQRHER